MRFHYVFTAFFAVLLSSQLTGVNAKPENGFVTINKDWSWSVCGSEHSKIVSFEITIATERVDDTKGFGTLTEGVPFDVERGGPAQFDAWLLNNGNMTAFLDDDDDITPEFECLGPTSFCAFDTGRKRPLYDDVWCVAVSNPSDSPLQINATVDLCENCGTVPPDTPDDGAMRASDITRGTSLALVLCTLIAVALNSFI